MEVKFTAICKDQSEEKTMCVCFLEILKKMPTNSVWFICDFMDDIWVDFVEFQSVKSFLVSENPYKSEKIVGIRIDNDFLKWYEDFIRDNYMFWGYLESHFIIYNNEFLFRAIESDNLLVIDSLGVPDFYIQKILSLGIHIVVDSTLQ